AWVVGRRPGLSVLPWCPLPARGGGALGTRRAGMSLGTLIGPPVGGLLFDLAGARLPFLVAAVWTLFLLVGLSRLPARAAGQAAPAMPVGWRRYLRTAGAVVTGSALLSGLEPTLPLHLEYRVGIRPGEVGMLFGWAALVYGLTAPAAGWAADRWGGRRVIAVGLVGCGVTLPLIAWPHT